MKIGIAVWQLDVKGGTQRQALELAHYLKRQGHTVELYAYIYDKFGCYPDLCEGLSISYVKNITQIDKADYPLTYLEYLHKYFIFFTTRKHKELLKLIPSDLDLFNPHDCGTYVTAGMWQKRYGKPVVWMMNDMPLYRFNLWEPFKTIGYYVKPSLRLYIRRFNEIVVLSHLSETDVQKSFNRQARVIRSGINLEKFQLSRKYEFKKGKKLKILLISVLFPHRKMEDAVRALKYLVEQGYDAHIIHCGLLDRSVKYAAHISNLIKQFGVIDRFEFRGAVSDLEIQDLFRTCDVYLFPNSPQTWGLTVFEAMASGIPAVLTRGAGAAEILTHCENAMITEAGRPDALAHAIDQLMRNERLRSKIIQRGREFVMENLSWEKYSADMLNLFKRILTSSSHHESRLTALGAA